MRRVIAVTGASSGIGRAMAVMFGAQGWAVALGGRRAEACRETARLVEQAGGEASAHVLDVTDSASVETFFDDAEAALGPVDGLVNNAGIACPGRFVDGRPGELEREVATNFVGPLLCSRRVLRGMLESRRGDLVFMSSDAGRSPRPGMIGYSASKGGLELAVHALAMELEGTGVRATVVRVGPTLTEFADSWESDRLGELMELWPRFGIQRHYNTMDPDDVARAALFALSQPPGMHVDSIEVQPDAPLSGG